MCQAVLTKKIKFPAHRVAKSKTFQDKILIGGRVQELKHQRVKKPIETVAVEFDCSVRKVEACWAVYQDFSQERQAGDYEIDMANEAHRSEAVQSLKDEHGDRDFSEEEIRRSRERVS